MASGDPTLEPVRFASGLKCSVASIGRGAGGLKRKILFNAGSLVWVLIIFGAFLFIALRM